MCLSVRVKFGQWDKSHPGVLPNHGKWFGAGQPAGRRARPVFGRFWPTFHAKNFGRCIFFLKSLTFTFFGTESWSESPKTIKIEEISSRAFERCGREPHTTRYDPSYGLAGWPAGWSVFVLFCFGNACFVLRAAAAAPTARFVLGNKTLF